jgi:hypothetical protein
MKTIFEHITETPFAQIDTLVLVQFGQHPPNATDNLTLHTSFIQHLTMHG